MNAIKKLKRKASCGRNGRNMEWQPSNGDSREPLWPWERAALGNSGLRGWPWRTFRRQRPGNHDQRLQLCHSNLWMLVGQPPRWFLGSPALNLGIGLTWLFHGSFRIFLFFLALSGIWRGHRGLVPLYKMCLPRNVLCNARFVVCRSWWILFYLDFVSK